jgi:hypothetical protein
MGEQSRDMNRLEWKKKTLKYNSHRMNAKKQQVNLCHRSTERSRSFLSRVADPHRLDL